MYKSDVVDVASDGIFKFPAQKSEVFFEERKRQKLKNAAELGLGQSARVGVASIEILNEEEMENEVEREATK